jgi:hypothetical protein
MGGTSVLGIEFATPMYDIYSTGAIITCSLIAFLLFRPTATRTTKLRGPPRRNLFLGCMKEVVTNSLFFEEWMKQYGSAFQFPSIVGSTDLVLCDPKAIAHFFSNDTFTYQLPPAGRLFFDTYVCSVLI